MEVWQPFLRRAPSHAALAAVTLAGLVLLAGCASGRRHEVFDLDAGQWATEVARLGVDPSAVESPVLVTPEIRRAATGFAGAGTETERLDRLHAVLLDRNRFGFEYERTVTFTASEAFAARRGNCVSFANLLIAFGRSLGIPMQAGLLVTRGTGEREGDLVVVYSHMVAVHPRQGGSFSFYDFYGDRPGDRGEIRLIDDLEIAAISLSNRGVKALRAGNLAVARSLLEKAVVLGPALPDLHSNLGIVLWRQGDVAGALSTFRKGLDLDPHRAALLQSLAALYLEMGRTAEARGALAAASQGQASPFLLLVKGDLELQQGDFRAARRSFRRARAKGPTLVEPLLGIARAEQGLGRPAAARKALERARDLDPNDERAAVFLEHLK